MPLGDGLRPVEIDPVVVQQLRHGEDLVLGVVGLDRRMDLEGIDARRWVALLADGGVEHDGRGRDRSCRPPARRCGCRRTRGRWARGPCPRSASPNLLSYCGIPYWSRRLRAVLPGLRIVPAQEGRRRIRNDGNVAGLAGDGPDVVVQMAAQHARHAVGRFARGTFRSGRGPRRRGRSSTSRRSGGRWSCGNPGSASSACPCACRSRPAGRPARAPDRRAWCTGPRRWRSDRSRRPAGTAGPPSARCAARSSDGSGRPPLPGSFRYVPVVSWQTRQSMLAGLVKS